MVTQLCRYRFYRLSLRSVFLRIFPVIVLVMYEVNLSVNMRVIGTCKNMGNSNVPPSNRLWYFANPSPCQASSRRFESKRS